MKLKTILVRIKMEIEKIKVSNTIQPSTVKNSVYVYSNISSDMFTCLS